MKRYSHKSNARRAARAELGAQAIEGVDYRLVPVPLRGGGKWGWERTTRHLQPASDKESRLKALLARKGGATVEEICEDTGWLPHSARARISGLRKAGVNIVRFKSAALARGTRGQETKYRIAGAT